MEYNTINLTLTSNGQTIEIGKSKEYKLIAKPVGLESSDYTVKSVDNNRYDGASIQNKRVEKRPIALDFEFPDYKLAPQKRRELIQVFNPKNPGSLTAEYCGNILQIDYEVLSFKDNQANLYEPLTCHVELIAPNPYFEDQNLTINEVTVWIGGFTFPLSLPFSLKQKGDPQIDIYIEGHVETPVEIIFHGPADKPTITNQTTGEFIKINRILTSDETLYINTAFGQKTVEVKVNGIRQNAFNYIDLNSTFFNLQPGDNLIDYTAGGVVTPDSVEIRYKNRYLGV